MAAPLITSAQEHGTMIMHEPMFQYTLETPENWVYNEDIAHEMRLNMVFYPDTTKWTKSPVVMYVNTTFKTDSNQTVEDVAETDIQNFAGDSPGVEAVYYKTVETYPQGLDAVLYAFENTQNNNYEWVAYIEHDYHVIMIVFGTRDRALFEQHEALFTRFTMSYFDLSRG